ncbi:unnamed protein product [Notodromas monacha]|uniref:GH18 domain-containing protein n=1 Tax=Notodromas monacha TaxID=399045 RepID=A0A7R9BDI9_9CRUS|nr:unnamed protein product [Notodromas monacha]CAG0912509.1 unnamed protein product [Notodromas monacha]
MLSDGFKVVCYLHLDAMVLEKLLEAPGCTHYVYEANEVQKLGRTVSPTALDLSREQEATQRLRNKFPEAKFLLGIGSWHNGGTEFFVHSETESRRTHLAQQAKAQLEKHGFDGIDLSYTLIQAQHRFDHQDLLGKTLRVFRDQLGDKYILAVRVSAPNNFYQQADALYDVQAIRDSVDWVTLAAFDLDQGLSLELPSHHSPLRMPGGHGLPANDVAFPEPTVPYHTLCQKLMQKELIEAEPSLKSIAGGPYATSMSNLVSYDDLESFKAKLEYIKGFGGVGLVQLNMDDYLGLCGMPWPMLTAATENLETITTSGIIYSN